VDASIRLLLPRVVVLGLDLDLFGSFCASTLGLPKLLRSVRSSYCVLIGTSLKLYEFLIFSFAFDLPAASAASVLPLEKDSAVLRFFE